MIETTRYSFAYVIVSKGENSHLAWSFETSNFHHFFVDYDSKSQNFLNTVRKIECTIFIKSIF
jgi:hypothetical protein